MYCLSRKECESLSADLRKAGIQAAPYHAGLSDKKREEVQAAWVADKYNVVSELLVGVCSDATTYNDKEYLSCETGTFNLSEVSNCREYLSKIG